MHSLIEYAKKNTVILAMNDILTQYYFLCEDTINGAKTY